MIRLFAVDMLLLAVAPRCVKHDLVDACHESVGLKQDC